MITRIKTSACDAAALETESDLTLSGIKVRASREGRRGQQKKLQNLTRKYNILPYVYHNNIGIMKSRVLLSGRKSDKGFEKVVQNTSCLSLWVFFFTFWARLGMKELKCYMKDVFFQI